MEERLHINWDFFIGSWKRILLGFLMGVLLSSLAYMLLPRKWEARALVQLGQVGQIQVQGQTAGQTMPIEPISIAMERMMLPAFIAAATKQVGRPEMAQLLLSRQYGGKGQLDVHQLRNTDLIVVKIRAESPELARLLAEGVAAEIGIRHARLAEPLLHFTQTTLSNFQSHLTQDEKNSAILAERISEIGPTGRNLPEYSMLLSSRLISEGTISQLRQTILVSQTTLLEPNTRPTRAIEPIAVQMEPVFPRPLHFIILGLVLGLMISVPLLMLKSRGSST